MDITQHVRDAVAGERGTAVLVYVPHTTAGVTINEHADPAVARDFEAALERIVDEGWPWEHIELGRGERADAHPREPHGPERRRPASRRRLARARNVAGDLLLRVRRSARPHRLRFDVLPEPVLARDRGRAASRSASARRSPSRISRSRSRRARSPDSSARTAPASRRRMRSILGLVQPDVGPDGGARTAVSRARPSRCTASARCSRRSTRTPGARVATTSACSRVRRGIPRARVDELLELVDLDRRGPAARQGLLARDAAAPEPRGRAARRPEVLVLDEPANGLDPQGIRWLRDLLRAQAARGPDRPDLEPRPRRDRADRRRGRDHPPWPARPARDDGRGRGDGRRCNDGPDARTRCGSPRLLARGRSRRPLARRRDARGRRAAGEGRRARRRERDRPARAHGRARDPRGRLPRASPRSGEASGGASDGSRRRGAPEVPDDAKHVVGFLLAAGRLSRPRRPPGTIGGTHERDRLDPEFQFADRLDARFFAILVAAHGDHPRDERVAARHVARTLLATPRRDACSSQSELWIGCSGSCSCPRCWLVVARDSGHPWLGVRGRSPRARTSSVVGLGGRSSVLLAEILWGALGVGGRLVQSQVGRAGRRGRLGLLVEPTARRALRPLDLDGVAEYLPGRRSSAFDGTGEDGGSPGGPAPWVDLAWVVGSRPLGGAPHVPPRRDLSVRWPPWPRRFARGRSSSSRSTRSPTAATASRA